MSVTAAVFFSVNEEITLYIFIFKISINTTSQITTVKIIHVNNTLYCVFKKKTLTNK